MKTTFKHTTSTLTWTGIRLTLVLLILLVSSCAQSGSPSVATQPSITPPARLNQFHQRQLLPRPRLEQHDHDAPTATVAADATASIAPLLGNLGDHTHPITAADPRAQQYFDEGLILAYGFNHAEAIRSFKDAITLDPGCAMCYWGIALALGPNINAPMEDCGGTRSISGGPAGAQHRHQRRVRPSRRTSRRWPSAMPPMQLRIARRWIRPTPMPCARSHSAIRTISTPRRSWLRA